MQYVDEPIQFISISSSSESPTFQVSDLGIKFFESLNEKKVKITRLLLSEYLALKIRENLF